MSWILKQQYVIHEGCFISLKSRFLPSLIYTSFIPLMDIWAWSSLTTASGKKWTTPSPWLKPVLLMLAAALAMTWWKEGNGTCCSHGQAYFRLKHLPDVTHLTSVVHLRQKNCHKEQTVSPLDLLLMLSAGRWNNVAFTVQTKEVSVGIREILHLTVI